MMAHTVLVGLVAGAASALLFASVASGSLFSIVLFYLSSLPILIAAIGWSHLAGLVAALAAAAGLASVLGGFFLVAFLAGVGLPAWFLGYLALLARPAAQPTPDGLEWFSVGRLVVWAAILGAAIVAITIPNFGTDAETFRAGLRRVFEMILRAQARIGPEAPLTVPGISDPQRMLDVLVAAIPLAAAMLSTLVNILNLWLAGRIVAISGRLKRPWPDIPSMEFPAYAPALGAAAVAGTFLPGLIGIVAGVLAASMLVAYALLGLAVLHAITRRVAARGFILGGLYVSIALFGWPLLLAALFGLVDSIINLRGRMAKKSGPPA